MTPPHPRRTGMKLVLDASVSARWVLPGPHSDKALKLRTEFENKNHDLLAPETFIGENANALIKAERQKTILSGSAAVHFADIMSTPPRLFPFTPFVARALEIASQTRAGFYDCLYVGLAEQEKCDLVTGDDRLGLNLRPQFPFIKHLSTF